MDANQVVAALVDPNTGVIVKMIDRLGKLEGERATIANTVGELSQQVNTLEQGTGQHITAIGQKLDALEAMLNDITERVIALESAPKAEAPKRTRKKKVVEPEPEVEQPVPEVEPEVVDPEAPAYEPGLVPDEVAGVKITGNVVMSIRNNIKVLTLQLAKTLNTEYPPELYDFVAGLTDDEAAAIAEKFPG